MQNLFEEIEVPREKLNQTIENSMDIIRRQSREKKKRKIFTGCTAAAVLVAAGMGFCAANPTIAADIPLIGNIFARESGKAVYGGDYTKDAEPVTGTNVSESNGVKITLSEMYCNTEGMNVSVLIESEEAFPDCVHDFEYQDGEETISYLFLDTTQEYSFLDAPIEWQTQVNGEFIDDHTFAGIFRMDLNVNEFYWADIPDAFQWKMDVSGISSAKMPESTEQYQQEGTWSFAADVSKDSSQTITKEVNEYAPNGMGIVSVEKTPYEIILNEDYREEANTMGDIEGLRRVILDADGKYMADKVGMIPVGDHNVSKIYIYFYPTSTEEAHREVIERMEDADFAEYIREIAVYHIEIAFEGE